ncbi:YadA-like family protein [uncultured Psychrobacter sp.]|uniref:YadA-like family protein n=1 Tax=uncultured Psychrobacter sp. TaxID=259303 RepID=UPI003458273F
MNRNYKVIWNQSLNCFMAVAEYAKSRGKSSSTTVTSDSSSTFNDTVTGGAQLLRLSALCIGLASAGFSMQAVAVVGPNSIDTNVCDATSNPSTAANKSTGDIAIGCNSDASGRHNIAIGGTATTKANAGATQGAQSIAIGYDAQTKGDQSIGLGANVRAVGNSSIAIGGDDLNSASSRNIDGTSNSGLNSGDVNQAFRKFAGRDLVYTDANGAGNPNIPDVNRRQYIGTETAGPASVAVGVQAQSVGALSTAFGTQATSIGVGSAAFGVSATATKAGSVALGAGAETDKNATSEKTVVIGGKTYNFAGSILDGAGGPVKTGAQVSVGATGLERQIKNVAGGRISADSTDAINGSQLAATNSALEDTNNNVTANTGRINTNANNITGNTNNIANLTNGRAGIVRQDNGTAPITVGSNTGGNSVNFTGTSGRRTLTGLANGNVATGSTDAITGDQLNTTNITVANVRTAATNAQITADNAQTTANTANTNANSALTQANRGFDIAADNGTANNVQLGEAVTFTNSDGNLVATVSDNAINYGLADDISVNQVTLGDATNDTVLTSTANGLDVGGDKITNIVDGTIAAGSTEAVTGNQLNATNTNVNTNANNIATNTSNIATNTSDIIDNRNVSQGNVTALGGGASYNAATDTYTAPTYSLNNDTDSFNNVGDALGNLDTRTTANTRDIATNAGNINTNANNITGNTGSISDLTNGRAGIVRQDAGTGAITVGATTGGNSIDLTGSNGARTLTGLANGNVVAGSTDAITGDQLNTTNTNVATAQTAADNAQGSADNAQTTANTALSRADLGFGIAADNGTANNIQPGEVVTFTNNDGNLVATVLDNAINYDLADDISVTQLTVGDGTNNTVLTSTANGLDVGGAKITNVADGNIAAGSTEAVTGNQLNATNANVTTNANNIATNTGNITTNTSNIATNTSNITDNRNASQGNVTALGGGASYNAATDTYTAPTYTLDDGTNAGVTTNVNNVGDALDNLDTRTTTNAGNINTNANNIAGNTGSIADLTNGRTGIVRQDTGTGAISVGAQTGGTSIDFTGTDGVRILTGLANGNVAADSTDAITGDQLNASAEALSTIVGGNAVNTGGVITVTNIGGTGVDNIDGAIASVNDTAIKAKSTVSEGDNIVIATTTNADGSTNYQVATANNLVLDSLTTGNTVTNNSGVTINDGANVTTLSSAGNTVTDGSNTSNYSAKGFTTNDNAGNSVMVNQTGLSFNNSAGATGPSVSATGINAGSTKISNLEAGTLSTDAVNKGQLDAITGNIAAGGVQYDRNTDDTVNYDNVSFAGTPAIIGTDENGNNVVVSGGTRLTNIANGINAADAVNRGQLDSATNIKVFNQNGDEVTVNVAEQVTNIAVNNDNLDSLFLTYNKSGQKATDRLSIGETVQKMNTEGVKFAHTNAVSPQGALGITNDSSAGGANSTAIGVNAIVAANAESTIALGHNTLATENATNAVVIGKDSQVGGASSIAIGNGSQANGNQSISVGTRNTVNGNNSGAFGDPTIINGDNSYSVGNNNTIASSDTFVLGNNVTQSVDGSVVLGTGSAATTGAGITGYRADTSNANDAILATTSSTGAVAVGDADNDVYRQVTGVAAGTADSDAVNVAQLRAVDTTLSNLVTGNIGLVQQAGNQNVITIGAATGGTSINVAGTEGNRQIAGVAAGTANTDALNVGQLGSVLGGNTTVADNGQINANLNVGGNQYNTVQDALTAVNTQTGQLNDAAVQYDRDADGSVNQNQITLGGGAEGTLITNVQNGNVAPGSRDAINGGQLNDTADSIAGVIGGNATNTGGVITATNIGGTGASTIDGAISSIQQNNASTNAAVSNNTANIASNSSDIQDNTGRLNAGLNFSADSGATINQPIGDNSAISFVGSDNITTTASDSGIQFDLNGNINVDTVSAASITTGNTTVNNSGVTIQDGPSMTTNGINAGNQVVTGVADGVEVNDAVNFGQLSALDRRLNDNVSALGYKINEVEDEANAGISAAMAMSSLPQAYIPGKSMVGGGIASYNGESAVAVGVSKVSDNGRWVIKANGTADTQGNAGGAIGAGFHF